MTQIRILVSEPQLLSHARGANPIPAKWEQQIFECWLVVVVDVVEGTSSGYEGKLEML